MNRSARAYSSAVSALRPPTAACCAATPVPSAMIRGMAYLIAGNYTGWAALARGHAPGSGLLHSRQLSAYDAARIQRRVRIEVERGRIGEDLTQHVEIRHRGGPRERPAAIRQHQVVTGHQPGV